MAILKVANIHFDAAGTTRLQANGANVLTIVTGNTEDARFDASGNLLIGRIDSTVGQGVKLDVAGAVNASAILVNGSSILTTSNSYTVTVGTAGNTYATSVGTAGNAYAQAVGTAGNAYAQAVGTAGNNYTITVGAAANGWANTISATRSTASNAYAETIGAASNTIAVAAFAKANSTTYTSNLVISVADNTNAALRITQTGTGEAFRVEDSANPDSTPFVVDASGRVGIGTTSLEESLTATGAIVSSGATAANKTSAAAFDYSPSGSFNSARILAWGPVGAVANISFWSGSGGLGATERIRIDDTGNLLIGRTTSTVGLGVKLDVNGAINTAALYVNGAPITGGATILDDTVNATRYVTFVDSTSGTMTKANVDAVLSFNPSTGTLSSTIFNSTSDETLKYDVKPIENALGFIDEMNGVSFKWKKNDQASLGVIAQDIEKVLPELVGTDGENKTVNYNGIIAVLIQAVKELSKRVEELESK
jgi:hypothetical protein